MRFWRVAYYVCPSYGDTVNRDWIIGKWFSDDSSVKVRTAALGYLAKCGICQDLEIAKKEYVRSDYGTSRSALECMLEILFRSGQVKAAQKLVLEAQFESLNINLLQSVLEGFESLENSELFLGLEHRNSQVRLRAMKALDGRDALDIGIAERLSGDSDALVRNEAISVLEKLGKHFVEKEIKKILTSPQKQSESGLPRLGDAVESDSQGEEIFQQYQLNVLKGLSEVELKKKVNSSLPFDNIAYFALVGKCFKKHVHKLRQDVDDRFSAYFEERIQQLEVQFGKNSSMQELFKKNRNLEDFLRKDLTRKGLDVLCVAKNIDDLQRIRTNLQDGYAGASTLDAKYLMRHGEWIDIPVLANAEKSGIGDRDFQLEVVRAIISISKKDSISDLFSLDMPEAILKKLIELCAESRFAKISQSTFLGLLNHESEGVRKAAAIMAVRSFTVKRIKSTLSEYVNSDKYRYYNVIHWLDLGVSMCRNDARKVARVAQHSRSA